MSNDIAVVAPQTSVQQLASNLAPTNFAELGKFSQMVANTQFVPQGYRSKPDDIMVCVMYGADLGFTPMQALQNIAVVNGRPSVYGDGLRALILARSDCQGIDDGYDGSNDEYHAFCIVDRRGKRPIKRTFSLRDAKEAGLLGKAGPWKQYRDRMLLMRAQGFAIRDAYADVLRGVISLEEAEWIPEPERGPNNARDVTPNSLPIKDVLSMVEVMGADGEIFEVLAINAATALDEMAADVDPEKREAWIAHNRPLVEDQRAWNDIVIMLPKPPKSGRDVLNDDGSVFQESVPGDKWLDSFGRMIEGVMPPDRAGCVRANQETMEILATKKASADLAKGWLSLLDDVGQQGGLV